jgi:hypothetical protein
MAKKKRAVEVVPPPPDDETPTQPGLFAQGAAAMKRTSLAEDAEPTGEYPTAVVTQHYVRCPVCGGQTEIGKACLTDGHTVQVSK